MFDSPDFDLTPYQDFDGPAYVQRTYCSGDDAGWRSLLVQCFDHVDEAEQLAMPAAADLHLVLCVAGDAVMHTDPGDRRWLPGTLELLVPRQRSVRSYRAKAAPRTIQVHLPWTTVARTRAELGGRDPDYEAPYPPPTPTCTRNRRQRSSPPICSPTAEPRGYPAPNTRQCARPPR